MLHVVGAFFYSRRGWQKRHGNDVVPGSVEEVKSVTKHRKRRDIIEIFKIHRPVYCHQIAGFYS